jgi:enoyl-[acyl-carrier-protein] reductase (NADH)
VIPKLVREHFAPTNPEKWFSLAARCDAHPLMAMAYTAKSCRSSADQEPCAFLASPYTGAMTGDTIYIDGGYHILG